MKVRILGHMDLEDLSHALQRAIAQLQDKGVKYVTGCNFYFIPVEREGDEITILDSKKKPIKEMVVKVEKDSIVNPLPGG